MFTAVFEIVLRVSLCLLYYSFLRYISFEFVCIWFTAALLTAHSFIGSDNRSKHTYTIYLWRIVSVINVYRIAKEPHLWLQYWLYHVCLSKIPQKSHLYRCRLFFFSFFFLQMESAFPYTHNFFKVTATGNERNRYHCITNVSYWCRLHVLLVIYDWA